MKDCLQKYLEERAKLLEEEARRNSAGPRVPRGLREVLHFVYEKCLGLAPCDLHDYVARKLEARLNRRLLTEGGSACFYEREDDAFYREEFELAARRDEEEEEDDGKEEEEEEEEEEKEGKKIEEKEIGVEVEEEEEAGDGDLFMTAYYNRDPRHEGAINDLVSYNILDSLRDACPKGKGKRQIMVPKVPSSRPCKRRSGLAGGLAWRTNGKGSIYNPDVSPLANYLRAHPEEAEKIFKRDKREEEGEEEEEEEECPMPPLPYWLRKKRRTRREPCAEPLAVPPTDSCDARSLETEPESDPDREDDLRFLTILINCYARIIDRPAEPTSSSLPDLAGEELVAEGEEAAVQTDYCLPFCGSFDLMEDVIFYSSTCLKMLETGPSLNSPCWTCLSARSVVILDWKEFFLPSRPADATAAAAAVATAAAAAATEQEDEEMEEKEEEEEGEEEGEKEEKEKEEDEDERKMRRWLDQSEFLDASFEEEEDDKIVPERYGFAGPLDEISEPAEEDYPQPLPEEIWYSGEAGKYVIGVRDKKRLFPWEAKAKPFSYDYADVLPFETRINIYLPPVEKPAAEQELDVPSEFPADMLIHLYPIEKEAVPDKPDTRNVLKLKKKGDSK